MEILFISGLSTRLDLQNETFILNENKVVLLQMAGQETSSISYPARLSRPLDLWNLESP